ncbi:MAG: glycosyltransferase [Alphaproteobacteria bacterium]|nr:glycosyltransferase [Alphaproteobacteria bacterium]
MIWIALAAAIAWAVMLFGRGGFWRAQDRDEPPAPDLREWPSVTVIIPARDEAPTIAATVRSLRAQDYAGALRVVVVDDRSTDGTGALARDAGAEVVTGTGRAQGWTGKLYALQQGLAAVQPDTRYILFTDADIAHAPDSVRRLVARAERHGLVLTSLMAKLRAVSPAERWFIPAFIYFFQMLYPFRWSNAAGTRTAAAAGGCVLLRRDAFLAAGGLEPIRGRIIDDCALAALMKRQGRIWLGLTDRVVSLRESPTMDPIRRMVARTAYAQLGHSPWLLVGTVLGLALVFLAPPLLAIFGRGPAQWLGALAWAAMALSFLPMLRFYGLSAWRAAALPAVAALYLAFTLDSAWQHYRGRGGMWKGEAAP